MWTDRTELLLGKEKLEKLKNSFVTVIGLGGVGGITAIMLARCGVGKLRLVDFDKIDETNINRQVVANTKTIGKYKTDVIRDMILDINPNCKIESVTAKLTRDNIGNLISKNTFVVDAIDSVKDKVELCDYCYKNEIPIISAMGAGNRYDLPNFKVLDIYKTSNDGLAKVMRKLLRERGVKKLNVVACSSEADKKMPVGSIAYYPAMCGSMLCAYVVNEIIK